MNRAVIVICDSLRRDLITPADAPFLTELGERSARFANHASVFPSTTRTSAASIATGACRRGTVCSAIRWRSTKARGSLPRSASPISAIGCTATGRTLRRPWPSGSAAAARQR
jgi:hypothetical protein